MEWSDGWQGLIAIETLLFTLLGAAFWWIRHEIKREIEVISGRLCSKIDAVGTQLRDLSGDFDEHVQDGKAIIEHKVRMETLHGDSHRHG